MHNTHSNKLKGIGTVWKRGWTKLSWNLLFYHIYHYNPTIRIKTLLQQLWTKCTWNVEKFTCFPFKLSSFFWSHWQKIRLNIFIHFACQANGKILLSFCWGNKGDAEYKHTSQYKNTVFIWHSILNLFTWTLWLLFFTEVVGILKTPNPLVSSLQRGVSLPRPDSIGSGSSTSTAGSHSSSSSGRGSMSPSVLQGKYGIRARTSTVLTITGK